MNCRTLVGITAVTASRSPRTYQVVSLATSSALTHELVNQGNEKQGMATRALMQDVREILQARYAPTALPQIRRDVRCRQIVEDQLRTLGLLPEFGNQRAAAGADGQ